MLIKPKTKSKAHCLNNILLTSSSISHSLEIGYISLGHALSNTVTATYTDNTVSNIYWIMSAAVHVDRGRREVEPPGTFPACPCSSHSQPPGFWHSLPLAVMSTIFKIQLPLADFIPRVDGLYTPQYFAPYWPLTTPPLPCSPDTLYNLHVIKRRWQF